MQDNHPEISQDVKESIEKFAEIIAARVFEDYQYEQTNERNNKESAQKAVPNTLSQKQ